MAAKGGNVKVRFGAETRDLERGAARAGRAVDTFAKHGTKAGGLLGTSTKHLLAYAGGITSIAAAAVAAKDAVKFTEDLAKSSAALARTTGLDIKTASEWVEISKVRGVQSQALSRGFITLAKNIRQVEQGSKTATRAFADLGVSQKTLASGDTNRILLETADAFKRMPDGVKQAAVAQQIFGRQSQALLPLLNQGSAKLREQLGLVDQYGVALDKHGVEQALKAVEAQRKWQLALDGIKVAFAQGVLPYLSRGVTAAANFIREMRTGEGAGGRFAAKLKDIWSGAKPVVVQLGKIVTSVGKFVAAHPGLTKVVGAMVALGLAVKAISFASQITGIGKLVGLFAKLGGVGTRGGASLADGILSGFSPKWAARKGTITSAIRRTGAAAGTAAGEAASGNLASRMGKTIGGKLKRIAAPAFAAAGTALGAALAAAAFAKILDEIGNWTFHVVGGRDVPNEARSPNSPQPDDPTGVKGALKAFGIDVGRKGGFMRGGKFSRYRGGGTVPALVSSGEVIVEPGGSAWRAPGAPVAADNVPAMLKPGSAVLTWDGQARMAAGASLGQAVAMQAPHFRTGGTIGKGETIAGKTSVFGPPTERATGMDYKDNVPGIAIRGMKNLKWYRGSKAHPYYVKVKGRDGVVPQTDWGPNSNTGREIDFTGRAAQMLGFNVGSGGSGFPTDAQGIAVELIGLPPKPIDFRTHPAMAAAVRRAVGQGSASAPGGSGSSSGGSRTRTTYRPPSPGTNRSSRATFDAGYEQGTSDPSNFGLRQARSDFYNQARSSIFGTWTTRTIAAPPRRHRDPGAGGGGNGPTVHAGDHYVNDRGQTFKISAKDAPNLAWWHRGRVAVAKWIYPQLAKARKDGWDGKLNTGWRSYEHQYDIYFRQGIRPAAYPGTSNHEGSIYPKGAVDAASARSLRDHLRGWHGPGQRLKWALDVGFNDPPHLSATGYRAGGFVGRRRGRFSTSGRPASALVRGHRTTLTLGAPGSSTSRPAPAPSGRRTTGRAVRESQRTPRQAAYAGLWALLNVGIGKGDQGEVKARLAHELAVIDGLSYDDLRVFAADAKAIYNRPWGTDAVSKTEKARVAQIIKYADTAIGRSIGRAVGVTEDVRDSIAGTEGRIDNQLTLAGIDPESAAGRQIKAAADTSAIGRLQTRRQALVTARRRALRAGRRDIAQNITGEITAVDDQILGLRVAIQDLTSTVGNATETAEAQLEQQRQTNELLQGQLDALRRTQAVSQSQYGVLAQAIADIASGQIGGRLGLAGQAAGTPGEVARY